MMRGLSKLRVVDAATGIAGPYCSKLFADAGADVIKLEPPSGDPLRRWSATGAELGDADGALFRYLNGGKRSVLGSLAATAAPIPGEVQDLLAGADLLVEDARSGLRRYVTWQFGLKPTTKLPRDP